MHDTGALLGTRPGGIPAVHSFKIAQGSTLFTTGTDIKLGTIKADGFNPTAYRIFAVVKDAYDQSVSAVLRAGVAAGGTTILNDVNIKATAGTNYNDARGVWQIVSANTDIYVRVTLSGTTAGVGEVWVLAELVEANVNPPTNQGD